MQDWKTSLIYFGETFVTLASSKSRNSDDIDRSSHQRCSIKKGVLKNFTKFTGKHLCQSFRLKTCNFIKKEALAQMFSCEFCKNFKDIFFTENLPSWHNDVVTTLSQRGGTVKNESCAEAGFRRCDNVALRRYQDVTITLLQRRHNIKHWICRTFYYRLFWFLSLHRKVRELQKCQMALNTHSLSLKERFIYS